MPPLAGEPEVPGGRRRLRRDGWMDHGSPDRITKSLVMNHLVPT